MTIWNGLTSDGAVVPIQVDDQGRVIAVGSGPDSPLVVDGDYLRPRDATKGLGTANIDLDADGTATFAGAVICLGDPNGGATNGTRLGSTVQCGAPSGLSPVWHGYVVGTTEPTSEIKANGSATFKGKITVGDDITDGNGMWLSNNGSIVQRKDTAGSCYELFSGGSTNAERVVVFSNEGKASFGTDSEAPASTNTEGCTIGSGGKYISICRESDLSLELNYKGSGGSGIVFRVLKDGDTNNPSVVFDLNGSASFAGQVTAKNITAFSVVLMAAVRNSTTFDELKTAIMEALAELVPPDVSTMPTPDA